MNKLNKAAFIESNANMDHVIGIRIKDGEFYFLGWMEAAENYKIQQAQSSDGYRIDKNDIIELEDGIFDAITNTNSYNSMYLLYETKDGNNTLVNESDKCFTNAYDCFLTCFPKTPVILSFFTEEWLTMFDLLKDGDYIFIIE